MRDVMTTDVAAVAPDARFEEIVDLLRGRRIRAVPVLDADRHLLGVVSEADVLETAEYSDPDRPVGQAHHRWSVRRDGPRPSTSSEAAARPTTARDLMTTEVVAVRPQDGVATAARSMRAHHLGWLPVVDPDARLVGVLGRSDLLRVFERSDEDLRREIIEEVFLRVLLVDPAGLDIVVRNGIVTLSGTVPIRADALVAVALVERLEGVVAVQDRLHYELDERRYDNL